MTTLEETDTSKGKSSSIYDGYQYRKHRINKDNVITWLCLKERTENCRGTFKSKNGIVLNVSNHVCKPDIEVKKRMSGKIKNRGQRNTQYLSRRNAAII
ncbi:hypothetical protein AVEN_16502-1 [Araneus ventricosus]|uniref:FLYWCH-type domain-containing protein n=1 Tax=Araneus ventricosus TaxID=182803 RepID=A0A4Y1ZTS1_ARAVE|nr:hypothetical protein AVEN_16502-1 [Araneus ventricosus]